MSNREPAAKRRVTAKLWEPADLYRIPLWLVAKPVYLLAPISFHFRLAALKGTIDSLRSPFRRRVHEALETYLGTAKPESARRAIARSHFQFCRKGQFARLWPQIHDFAGADKIEIVGLHHLEAALASGRGAIIVTAHFGYARLIRPILRSRGVDALLVGPQGANIRDMPPFLTRLGTAVHTRFLRLPRASRADERWRRTVGEDLPTGLNLRPHLAALKRNETLIILTDGRAANALSRVPVLGIDVYFAPGALSLARTTGAAALPGFVVDDPGRPGVDGFRLEIHPPLELRVTDDAQADLDENLSSFVAVYEQQVRSHPHNWHWTWVRDGAFDNPVNPLPDAAKRRTGTA